MTSQVMQTGILDLVSQAGLVVRFVLLILAIASVFCWAVIFMKSMEIRYAIKHNASFLEMFWNSKNLEEIYNKVEKLTGCPVANVFKSGYRELKKVNAADRQDPSLEVENIQRALMRTSQYEAGALERYVPLLATTASTAPFVGLFGTVWGIMSSFRNIGASGAANLAVVAPGISEALIATAVGLAAAIPAVVAYNHFANRIRRVTVDMDCFTNDMLNIIQRSLMTSRRKPSES